MDENNSIQLFEDRKIRTAWDEEKEEWYFSVQDVVAENALIFWSVISILDTPAPCFISCRMVCLP